MDSFERSQSQSNHNSGLGADLNAPLATAFRLDEGYAGDASNHDENGRTLNEATAARFQEWVMAQSEDARAEIAYEILRTLRTSNIAGVVDRLTPLLHMDPIEKLPAEITSQVFSYLDAQTLLTAALSSRQWRARIMDSMLWQGLYKAQGWGFDQKEINDFEAQHALLVRQEFRRARGQLPGQPQLKKRATSDWLESKGRKVSADVSQWREQHGVVEADTDMQSEDDHEMQDAPPSVHNSPQRPNKRQSQEDDENAGMDYRPQSSGHPSGDDVKMTGSQELEPPLKSRLLTYDSSGTERVNWFHLFKQRRRLEENWTKGRFRTFQLPDPAYPKEAHTECVYTIQFYGKWLVSGSRDKTLRIWDLETRRLARKPLVGHSQSVLCLQFDPTPEEDVIISGSSDSSVIIWQFSTGNKINEIPSAHEESVLNLRFDHRYLVTCSKDRKIKVWNRRFMTARDPSYPKVNGNNGARIPSYIVNINDMEPSLLETRLANGTIRSLNPYTLLMTLEGHGAAVNAIQINGDLIVSASGDRMIKVWRVSDGKVLRTLPGHHKGIACVQFDSRRIVSGSSDNTVRIYDPYTSSEVAELKGHTNLVRTVQAGFGDLPGAEEDDLKLQKECEQKYIKDIEEGVIVEDDRGHRRAARSTSMGSSKLAIGSRLPPGGGGSKWGRIVSGSYDESIIIWRKDPKGHWVVGQTLRQDPGPDDRADPRRLRRANPAAQVPVPAPAPPTVPQTLVAPAAQPAAPQVPNLLPVTQAQQPQGVQPAPVWSPANSSNNAGTSPAVVAATSQLVQQAMGVSLAGFGNTISNLVGSALPGRPNLGAMASNSVLASAASHTQGIVSQAVQHALQQHAQQHGNAVAGSVNVSGTVHAQVTMNPNQPGQATAQMSAPVNATAPVPPDAAGPANAQHPANAQQQHHQQQQQQQQSVSRVFKLQFDARRIVCCSQDSRIVGWDFADGDKEIMEACRFFVGP